MAGNRLQHLNANDWILVQAKAVRHSYKLGDQIIRQGEWPNGVFIIREGQATVELAESSSRATLARLGPGDICGEISFLEQGKATAAVIASDEQVEVDEIGSRELRAMFEAFPGLASRFYLSLAVLLAQRLKETSKELAHEISLHDRRDK
jgi:CRP-like cAMP-binding protein